MIIVKSRAFLEKLPAPVVLFAAFAFYAFFSVIAGSPIFASDEYVYFISGKYVGQLSELYSLDPKLQRLPNLIFFYELKLFGQIVTDNFVSLFRLVHSVEYVLAGALLYASAKTIMPKPHALLGLMTFLALPSHIYIYAVMPEIELILLSATITFVLVMLYQRRPFLASTVVGLLASVALLIKPHAVATLAAVLVLLPVVNFLCLRAAWIRISFMATICFVFAAYIGVIGLWSVMDGTFTLDPSGALGLTFYGQYIDSNAASVGIEVKLLYVWRYFLANLAVVVLLFLPVFVWVGGLVVQFFKGRLHIGEEAGKISSRTILLALFAMLLIAAHLLMTAWFTAGAAILNAGEAQRVHGRYLGPALVAFPFLFFFALSQLSHVGRKYLIALMLVTLTVSYGYVSQFFKIYPWDNPLLFSFFSEGNWYGWSYTNLGVRIGDGLYVVILLALVASFLVRRLQSAINSAVLGLILVAGCFQSYLWMWAHLNGNSEISNSAYHLGGLIGRVEAGDGIVVGRERYGRESYLLFNLANAPKVIDRPEGSDITPQDVSGYAWLVTDGSYNTDALGLPSVQVGSLKYYALKSSAAIGLESPKAVIASADKSVLKPAASLDVSLASVPAGTNLIGFNPVEPWGAWTSRRAAEIELPVRLQGRIRIKLFGWTLEQNMGETISLQVGHTVRQLRLGASGADAQAEFDVDADTDRILITSAVDKPADSARTLGVAIARLSVERL
jgi:hypothetical protein